MGRHGWLTFSLVVLIVLTKPFTLGDTNRYVSQIVASYGRAPFEAGSPNVELGHLFWRPVGWMLLEVSAPVLGSWFHGNLSQLCTAIMILMNAIAGLLSVLIWHSLAIRMVGSRLVAYVLALAFACANGFLTYMRSGSAYVVGLCFVSIGAWIVYRATERKVINRTSAWTAGLALAAATLFWLPYVLSLPGVIFLIFRRQGDRLHSWGNRDHLLFAGHLLGVWTVAVTFCIGLAVGTRHFSSVAEAKAWVVASGNGWSQTNRPIRIVTGLPRSFLYFGKDGVLYKRFLWKDPYDRVTVSRLVHASLWKLAFFYAFAAGLVCELLLRVGNRRTLVMLLVATVPTIVFAIFIFEPGSPERYLSIYPFLIMAIAQALHDYPQSHRPLQHLILAFLAGMVATNVYSTYRPRIDQEDVLPAARISSLKVRLRDQDLASVLSNQDTLYQFLNRSPFHPLNEPKLLRLYDVIETGSVRTGTWREEFAARALEAWKNGGEVWVSKRLWSDKPLPEWDWVEGDDRRVSWKDLPAFFTPLQIVEESGGSDGFFRLVRSDPNVARLRAVAGGSKQAVPP